MTRAAPADLTHLEGRRRLAFRASLISLFVAIIGFPMGAAFGGSERNDTIGGAWFFAAIIGSIATPWIVRAWQSFMRRQMVTAAVAGRTDIRHLDAEQELNASQRALASGAFNLAAFRSSGLVEPFESAGVDHVLTGEARGVPYAIAEISLLDAKAYRLFRGVLASFRLSRPRPGLTIVTRDRGTLGNLLARAGGQIERLTLEDPRFESLFEAYGDSQVGSRVILTTTMLERLADLDRQAHAHGFAGAFLEDHLLVALPGMSWRCAWWRISMTVGDWLEDYAAWLAGLVDLPVDIVHTLNLAAPSPASGTSLAPALEQPFPIGTNSGHVFSAPFWRLVGEGGTALIYMASGSLFGGCDCLIDHDR
jgi:hypothetical protein